MKLYKPTVVNTVHDEGTDNQHYETKVYYDTVVVRLLDRVGPKLSNLCMVVEFLGARRSGKRYNGYGFYMSMPRARRLRWVWNGESIYSLFWGSRANRQPIEIVNDRKWKND